MSQQENKRYMYFTTYRGYDIYKDLNTFEYCICEPSEMRMAYRAKKVIRCYNKIDKMYASDYRYI